MCRVNQTIITQCLAISAALGIVACDPQPDDAELAWEQESTEELEEVTSSAFDDSEFSPESVPTELTSDEDLDPSALTGTHKICSVYVPGNWRDTLEVPQGWNSTACDSFRASVGAAVYQLGCVTDGGFVWGPGGAAPPFPNDCGW